MSGAASGGARWLSIVGIGEDGAAGLSPRAAAAIRGAVLVFGGARHLSLAAPLIHGEAQPWPSPFADGIAAVLAARGRPVCVLASGDPFFHGVGATLARHLDPSETDVVPGVSSVSLAAARLGWPLHAVTVVSAHGRPPDVVRPALQPGARLLVLTSDEAGPAALAAVLVDAGFGASPMTVLEALGGPRERMRACPAAAFDLARIDPLNVVAIRCVAAPGARLTGLVPGRDEALFEHDGQITRREVRATILALLRPGGGDRLWDVGAGSGSVAVEWMLAAASLRAVAIEPRPDRAARIRRNAAAFGVPGLLVVEAAAPAAFAGLPPPDAVFVGGGATAPGALHAGRAALRPGGRLVAAAVTLETEALLVAARARHGGALVRIAAEHAEPLGAMTGWRPARAVVLWSWTAPW